MPDGFFQVTKAPSAGAGQATVVALQLPQFMDSREFDRLNEQLLEVLGAQPRGRWVLDLSGVNYLGSSALGLMVNIRQRIRQSGGQLVLCCLSPRLLRIFQTCCMERLFLITRTVAEAIREVGQ